MDIDFIGIWADDLQQTLPHGYRACIGIGHAENIVRQGIGFHQDLPDADGQDLGFARTWACDYHYWPFNRIDRLFLSSVEFGVFVLVSGEDGHGVEGEF